MGKKSTNLLLISLVILLLLGVNIFFIIFHTNNIEDDATAINSAGIIRGSIQRIIKLEINGIVADEAIRETDKVFEAFKSRRIIIKGKSQEFTILFDKMAENWTEIKNNIKSYRLDRTEEERRKLLNLSENIWENANDMVLAAQQVSQGKVRNFNILVLLLLINILPVIILFVYIKAYVKDKLEFLANRDPLTHVFNRNFLYSYLSNEIERANRYSNDLSLIMVDIDHFKHVNDKFGHDAGDTVLKELAEIFRANVRKSDIVARYGGEEFIIVAVQTKLEQAAVLAEKIRSAVENKPFKDIGRITVSLGVSSFAPGDDIDSLSKRADKALYLAKNNGRNRIEVI